MDLENSKNIRFEDLLLNDSFREFVTESNPVSVLYWKEWIITHPEKIDDFNRAVLVLKTLLNARKIRVPVDKNESLKFLLSHINHLERKNQKSLFGVKTYWIRIAAILIIALGFTSVWRLISINKVNRNESLYTEVIVPLGEKAQIILTDGTHVWINSASKLKYPVKFGEDSRDVFLEGEAFFDVAKQDKSNFIVNTRDVKVKVLGTAFNVKCYPGDEKTQTTVVRGLVNVEGRDKKQGSVLIKPNEMVSVKNIATPEENKNSGSTMTISRVDPAIITSWKDQMLVFAGEPFEDLAVKMERWFNVVIRIEDNKLREERFNGKFVHNETVYQVLEAINLTTPINYRVKNDTIFINRKNIIRRIK